VTVIRRPSAGFRRTNFIRLITACSAGRCPYLRLFRATSCWRAERRSAVSMITVAVPTPPVPVPLSVIQGQYRFTERPPVYTPHSGHGYESSAMAAASYGKLPVAVATYAPTYYDSFIPLTANGPLINSAFVPCILAVHTHRRINDTSRHGVGRAPHLHPGCRSDPRCQSQRRLEAECVKDDGQEARIFTLTVSVERSDRSSSISNAWRSGPAAGGLFLGARRLAVVAHQECGASAVSTSMGTALIWLTWWHRLMR
jgi:hypothetical protein